MKRVILLFFCILVVSFTYACKATRNESKKTNDVKMVKTYCINYASKYEIVKTGEDGSVQTKIKAPDFATIIESILDEKTSNEVTVLDIEDAVKSKPECTKDYIFWVDSEDDDIIKKRFLDEISRDLAIKAIENVEYTEEWSTEQ